MKIIESERLILRTVDISDAAFYLHLVNQPSFIEHIGDKGVYTEKQARTALIAGIIAQQERLGYSMYMVERRSDMAVLGMYGLIKRESFSDVDIGCAFLPQYWGRDYALEAGGAVLRYAADSTDLERVIALVAPANRGSIRLVDKLGFEFERMDALPAGPVKVYARALAEEKVS